jgi:hypothetical protein
LLALWKEIWANRGGLAPVLLDDPQALFDSINAENLAAVIPVMMEEQMNPIVLSNDNHFLAAVTQYVRARGKLSRALLLELSPISSSKLRV